MKNIERKKKTASSRVFLFFRARALKNRSFACIRVSLGKNHFFLSDRVGGSGSFQKIKQNSGTKRKNIKHVVSTVQVLYDVVKVGTHEGTSPCGYFLQQVAGTSPIV